MRKLETAEREKVDTGREREEEEGWTPDPGDPTFQRFRRS
jgi:hypothetical protein